MTRYKFTPPDRTFTPWNRLHSIPYFNRTNGFRSLITFALILVLGVSRDDDILTIQRIYRNLAKRHHPDRWKAPQDKADAEERFRLIATAYEILRDPAQKLEYDYMLDNPAEMYYNYYRYFKRQYSAKIDVRLVIASTILILSTIQVSLSPHSNNC